MVNNGSLCSHYLSASITAHKETHSVKRKVSHTHTHLYALTFTHTHPHIQIHTRARMHTHAYTLKHHNPKLQKVKRPKMCYIRFLTQHLFQIAPC